MRDYDVDDSGMPGELLTDAGVERLIRGDDGATEFDGVAALFTTLRDVADSSRPPAVGPQLAALFAAEPQTGKAAADTKRPGSRRRKGAAGLVIVIGSVAGLGAAGALPRSVQRAMSDAADTMGITLPAPSVPDQVDATPGSPAPNLARSSAPSAALPGASTAADPSSVADPTRPSPRGQDPGRDSGDESVDTLIRSVNRTASDLRLLP